MHIGSFGETTEEEWKKSVNDQNSIIVSYCRPEKSTIVTVFVSPIVTCEKEKVKHKKEEEEEEQEWKID